MASELEISEREEMGNRKEGKWGGVGRMKIGDCCFHSIGLLCIYNLNALRFVHI